MEQRPGADHHQRAHLVNLEHCGPLDRHERGYNYLHARRWLYRGWNELVASDDHDLAGQHDCTHSDGLKRARRNQIWSLLPCSGSRFIRYEGRKYSCHAARDRGLRLVWYSDMDWRVRN